MKARTLALIAAVVAAVAGFALVSAGLAATYGVALVEYGKTFLTGTSGATAPATFKVYVEYQGDIAAASGLGTAAPHSVTIYIGSWSITIYSNGTNGTWLASPVKTGYNYTNATLILGYVRPVRSSAVRVLALEAFENQTIVHGVITYNKTVTVHVLDTGNYSNVTAFANAIYNNLDTALNQLVTLKFFNASGTGIVSILGQPYALFQNPWYGLWEITYVIHVNSTARFSVPSLVFNVPELVTAIMNGTYTIYSPVYYGTLNAPSIVNAIVAPISKIWGINVGNITYVKYDICMTVYLPYHKVYHLTNSTELNMLLGWSLNKQPDAKAVVYPCFKSELFG
jgi:hypothetical protein